MGTETPKQFLLLQGKPLLQHSLEAFLKAYDDMQIILVLPEAHIERGREIINAMEDKKRIRITTGGDTRFQSVKNGLKLVQRPAIIFVHDAVRCLVSIDLIRRCYEQAYAKGSAVPAVAATDSIRIAEGATHSVMDRTKVRLIQTPQTFHCDLIMPAFDMEYEERFTDEATVVEAFERKVHLIEGDYNNIKITRPLDLYIAEKLLQEHLSLQPM